jgi:hypothetical protein
VSDTISASKSPRALTLNVWHKLESELQATSVESSGKVLDTHSVGSIFDYDLGVFTITKIALENTNSAPPAHPLPWTKTGYGGWQRCRAPSAPLTRLARLTAGQSLCTGHVSPQWKSKRVNTTDTEAVQPTRQDEANRVKPPSRPQLNELGWSIWAAGPS